MIYPNNVKKIRNQKGITLEKLSKKADISPSAINLIENGRRVPSVINARKISLALDTEIDILFPFCSCEK